MARERSLIIRPFDHAFDQLLSALDDQELKTSQATYLPGEYSIRPEALKRISEEGAELVTRLNEAALVDACDKADLDLSNVRFSIRTFSQFTNLSEVVFSESLANVLRDPVVRVPIGAAAREDQNPVRACHTGFLIQTVLSLNVERPYEDDKPLAPRLKHSILSESSFLLRPIPVDGLGIDFLPLTPQVRQAERVTKESIFYIKRKESPLFEQRLQDCVDVYVDWVLLDKIKNTQGSTRSDFFTTHILLKTLDAIITRASIELNARVQAGDNALSFEPFRQTVLGKLITILHRAAQVSGAPRDEGGLMEELIQDPSRTSNRIEEALSALSQALDTFDEEE